MTRFVIGVGVWALLLSCVACEDEVLDAEDLGAAGSGGEAAGSGGGEAPGACVAPEETRFAVADARLDVCYGYPPDAIECPGEGEPFFGQDAHYTRLAPAYQITCEGDVVLDENTGLMWERAHQPRVSFAVAEARCEGLTLGGFEDWRVPTIKELISISDWRGSQHVEGAFYVDEAFDFDYPELEGDELTGTHQNRMMGQTWSSTRRPDAENLRSETVYFFNFLDAHIKSQSATNPDAELFQRCVRGAPLENDLEAQGDVVVDHATGLMWQRRNGEASGALQFYWGDALAYCEGLELGGHDDWRLPDVKALQSIVDYAPADWAERKMALDTEVFEFALPEGTDLHTPPTTSPPNGSSVAPFFWSSTTHGDSTSFAAYVCFGPCWSIEDRGFNHDIHGPGAQRSDPKHDQGGQIWSRLGESIGDQQDVVQIRNFVRCVRDQ